MSYAVDGRRAKGTALYARKLIENLLDDDRFDFYLVHYEKSDEPMYKKATEIIMPKVRLPYGSHFVSQLLFFWKYRKEKFDIIHWFQGRLYPFFWLAPAKKIVVTTHDAGDITAPGKWIFSREVFNFVLKAFHKKVGAFIGVSEWGRQEIKKYYHADPAQIYVTYNGGGEDFNPLNKEMSFGYISKKYGISGPFILDISRLIPHKNVYRLVEAYILFRKSDREEKLVIVGQKGSEAGRIFGLIEHSHYKNDIIFIDYISAEDLNSLYSASEMLVFPSLHEGFGLPIVEAMASGTPVLSSNVTSMPEIAGGAAILVDPYNVEEIWQKMKEVLEDKNLRQELVKKGLERAKKFTWKQTAEETKKIYLNLHALHAENNEFGHEYFSTLRDPDFYKNRIVEEFDLIMKFCPPEKGEKVLDMGCGKGWLGSFLSDNGADVTFADISPLSNKYAAGKFLQCGMTDTPFPDNSFDKIYSLLTGSHIKDDDRAIQEMYRICKDKGHIFINTSNAWAVYLGKLLAFLRLTPVFNYDTTVKHLYTKRTFKKLMKKNGWKIRKFRYYGKYGTSKLHFDFLKTRLLIVAYK